MVILDFWSDMIWIDLCVNSCSETYFYIFVCTSRSNLMDAISFVLGVQAVTIQFFSFHSGAEQQVRNSLYHLLAQP